MPRAKSLVVLEGYDELRRAIRALPPEIKKELRKLDKEHAERIVELSDPPVSSGRLARSNAAKGDSKGAVAKSGSRSRVPYAPPIYWGWDAHNIEENQWFARAMAKLAAQGGWEEAYLEGMLELLKDYVSSDVKAV